MLGTYFESLPSLILIALKVYVCIIYSLKISILSSNSFNNLQYHHKHYSYLEWCVDPLHRRMAENGFASPPPPLGNFADISYIVEN